MNRPYEVLGRHGERHDSGERPIGVVHTATQQDDAAGARRDLKQEISAIAPRQVQIFPRRSRIIRIRTISPMPPVGPYPQLLLCPHVGNTPTKAKIRMIRRIVPILICHLWEDDSARMERNGARGQRARMLVYLERSNDAVYG